MKIFKNPTKISKWLIKIPAATLFLAFILSTGPSIQLYSIALLNSETPSIYGSAYQESLIKFPSLGEWIKTGLELPYILMALIITITITTTSETRKIAWRSLVMSFFVLSTYDICHAIYNKQLTIKYFSESFASNLAGGFLICSIIIIIFSIADFIYTKTPAKQFSQEIAFIAFLPLAGMTTSSAIYYMLEYLYNPKPANIEVSFSASTHGYIVPALKKSLSNLDDKKEKKPSSKPFSFMPNDPINGNVNLTTVKTAPRLSFTTPQNFPSKNISIFLLSECRNVDSVKKIDKSTPWLKFDNITELEASFDDGHTIFHTINDADSKSIFTVNLEHSSLFHLDQADESKKIKITQMLLNKGESIEISSNARELNFFLAAIAVKSISENEGSTSPRILNLKIGSQTYIIKFNPPRSANDMKTFDCSLYPTSGISNTPGHKEITSAGFIPGVLISIKENLQTNQKSLNRIIKINNTVYRIDNVNGWSSISEIDPQQMKNASLGELQGFQIEGNLSNLIIDGSPLAINKTDIYTARGKFKIDLIEEGAFHLSGRASSLWKKNSRMNKTKWEQLDLEIKILLITAIISFIAYLFSILVNKLRSETRLSWIS